jgi:hypothetical protein
MNKVLHKLVFFQERADDYQVIIVIKYAAY